MPFSRIFPRVFTRFLPRIIATKFTIMKAFCYIPSFLFLRTYLICRFSCNDIHFANTSRARYVYVFHFLLFPGRIFYGYAENCCRRNRYNPVTVYIYSIFCPAVVETNPTIEGTVEITKTRIFLLNRAGKLHRLFLNKRIAKYRAGEIILVSDREPHRIPLALSRKESL